MFGSGRWTVTWQVWIDLRTGDPHGDAVADHRSEFVGLVANASVVRDNHPAALTYRLQPGFVGTVVGKVIAMSLDRRTGGGKNLRKALPEVAVSEKDRVQAARSYSTASSISGGVRS